MTAVKSTSVATLFLLYATATPLFALQSNTKIHVDESGAHRALSFPGHALSLEVDRPQDVSALSSPGIQWILGDGGLGYIPQHVAIGAGGGMALWGCYLNNERSMLHATTTDDPSEALIWEDLELSGASSSIPCVASDETDRFVALTHFDSFGGTDAPQTVLYGYGSGSSTPDWVYLFPYQDSRLPKICMSKDGSFVVSAYSDEIAGLIEITYFDATSGAPVYTDSFPGGFLRVFDISDDASLLYLFDSGNNTIYIYDSRAGEIIFSVAASGGFDSHTMSGDGSAFAFGGFGTLKYYAWNGTTYDWRFTHSVPGSVYCSRADLSGDGLVLAAAFYNYSTGLDFSVFSIDGASGNLNFEAEFTGGGIYQNSPSDIKVTADGSRIAYAGWGDQLNTNPEVMVFEGSASPIASMDTRGSVFAVDISAAGQFVVSGSKAIHANENGRGGDRACLYVGGETLALSGVPKLSSTVIVAVEGEAGETVLLAGSLHEVAIQTPWGLLRVDPNSYRELGTMVIPGSGLAEFELVVPTFPGWAGKKVVIQAQISGGSNPRFTNARVAWILP